MHGCKYKCIQVLVGRSEGTGPRGRPRFRWEGSISRVLIGRGLGCWFRIGRGAGCCAYGNETSVP